MKPSNQPNDEYTSSIDFYEEKSNLLLKIVKATGME